MSVCVLLRKYNPKYTAEAITKNMKAKIKRVPLKVCHHLEPSVDGSDMDTSDETEELDIVYFVF